MKKNIFYILFLLSVVSLTFYIYFDNTPSKDKDVLLEEDIASELSKLKQPLLNYYRFTSPIEVSQNDDNNECISHVILPKTSKCIPVIATLAEQLGDMVSLYSMSRRMKEHSIFDFENENIDYKSFKEDENDENCSKTTKGLCGLFNTLENRLAVPDMSLAEDSNTTNQKDANLSKLGKDFYKLQRKLNKVKFQNALVSLSPWLLADGTNDSLYDKLAMLKPLKDTKLLDEDSLDNHFFNLKYFNAEEEIFTFKNGNCSDKNDSFNCNLYAENLDNQLKQLCSENDEDSSQCQWFQSASLNLKKHLYHEYTKFFYIELEKAYNDSRFHQTDINGTIKLAQNKQTELILLMDILQTLSYSTRQWLGINLDKYEKVSKKLEAYISDKNFQNINISESALIKLREDINGNCSSPYDIDNNSTTIKYKSSAKLKKCNGYFIQEIKYTQEKLKLQKTLTELFTLRYKLAKKILIDSKNYMQKKMLLNIVDKNTSADSMVNDWLASALYLTYIGEASKKMYSVTDNVSLCDTNKNDYNHSAPCIMSLQKNPFGIKMDISTYPIDKINDDLGGYKFTKPLVHIVFDKEFNRTILKKRAGVDFTYKLLNGPTILKGKAKEKENIKEIKYYTDSYSKFNFGPKMLLDSNVTVEVLDNFNTLEFIKGLADYERNRREQNQSKKSKLVNSYLKISKINIDFAKNILWSGQVQATTVEDFLKTIGMADGIKIDSSVLKIENNEMILSLMLSPNIVVDSMSINATFNLTSGSPNAWFDAIKKAKEDAILSSLQKLNEQIRSAKKVPLWLNVPRDIKIIGMTVESIEPLRFAALAHPKGKPSLVSSYRLEPSSSNKGGRKSIQWKSGKLILPPKIAMFLSQDKQNQLVQRLPSIEPLIQAIFKAENKNRNSSEKVAYLKSVSNIYAELFNKKIDGDISKVSELIQEAKLVANGVERLNVSFEKMFEKALENKLLAEKIQKYKTTLQAYVEQKTVKLTTKEWKLLSQSYSELNATVNQIITDGLKENIKRVTEINNYQLNEHIFKLQFNQDYNQTVTQIKLGINDYILHTINLNKNETRKRVYKKLKKHVDMKLKNTLEKNELSTVWNLNKFYRKNNENVKELFEVQFKELDLNCSSKTQRNRCRYLTNEMLSYGLKIQSTQNKVENNVTVLVNQAKQKLLYSPRWKEVTQGLVINQIGLCKNSTKDNCNKWKIQFNNKEQDFLVDYNSKVEDFEKEFKAELITFEKTLVTIQNSTRTGT